jgi:hypothetical protein
VLLKHHDVEKLVIVIDPKAPENKGTNQQRRAKEMDPQHN